MIFLNFIKFFGFFIMGYALTGMLGFVMEDTLSIQPTWRFMGKQYTFHLAWILVTAPIFWISNYIIYRLEQQKKKESGGIIVQKIFLSITICFVAGYCAYIIYLFLSGDFGWEDLSHIVLTLFMLACGGLYIAVNIYTKDHLKTPQNWLYVNTAVTCAPLILGFGILLSLTPPRYLKSIKDDHQTYQIIRDIYSEASSYAKKYEKLPQDLNLLMTNKLREKFSSVQNNSALTHSHYTIDLTINEATLKICMTPKANWKYAHRSNYPHEKHIFENKARVCKTGALSENTKKKWSLEEQHTPIPARY